MVKQVFTIANIIDGGTLQASHHNNEYNAIQAAFNVSTGHNHDGSAGEGAPILAIGPAQDFVASGSSLSPKTTATYSLGTTGARFTTGWFSGAVTAGGFTGPLTGAVTGNVTGNADTATTWANARTITLGGDLTGNVSINGSANVTLNAEVVNDSHTHDTRYYTETEVDALLASTLASATLAAAPTGVILPYTGTSAPSGWTFCGGQAISRTTFATLFSAIGTTFGSGDGSTTFNVPDLRGRAIFGKDNMGPSDAANRITNAVSGIVGTTLGASGGSEALHAHTHGVTDPGHSHTVTNAGFASNAGQAGIGANTIANDNTAVSNTTGITIDTTGTGGSQNMPPAFILNYIIKH